jgi:hypothetical protein
MTGKTLILLGLLIFAVGIYFGYSSYSFLKTAGKTEGRVDSIEKSKKRITPTFEYTVKGKKYMIVGPATHPDEYIIGDTETIYYEPENPEDAKIGTFMNTWFLPAFLTGFGFILAFVGLVVILSTGKKNPAFTIKGPGNL